MNSLGAKASFQLHGREGGWCRAWSGKGKNLAVWGTGGTPERDRNPTHDLRVIAPRVDQGQRVARRLCGMGGWGKRVSCWATDEHRPGSLPRFFFS